MKKVITITLYMSEMLYDIQNKTYLKGRSKTEIDSAKRAYMQANEDDENLNQLLRSIGDAYGTLKSEFSEYVNETASTGNNVLISDQDITITLEMPNNFNEAAVSVISTGFHKYIVNTSIAGWYDLTSPDDVKTYLALAAENLKEVHDGINKRLRPVRTSSNNNTEEANNNTEEVNNG